MENIECIVFDKNAFNKLSTLTFEPLAVGAVGAVRVGLNEPARDINVINTMKTVMIAVQMKVNQKEEKRVIVTSKVKVAMVIVLRF